MKQKWIGLMLLVYLLGICMGCSPAAPAVEGRDGRIDSTSTAAPSPKFNPDEPISEYVRRIFRDSQGRLWLGTNSDGVYVHDGKDLQQYSVDQGLAGRQVTGIVEAEPGQIWFATDGGVSAFDGKGFKNYTTDNGLTANHLWSIFRDRKGVIWAGTESGLCRLEGDRFVQLKLPEWSVEGAEIAWSRNAIFSIADDSKGNLLIGTDGMGALIYDGKEFTQLSTRNGLCGNTIGSILTERNGKTWFSSMFGGDRKSVV